MALKFITELSPMSFQIYRHWDPWPKGAMQVQSITTIGKVLLVYPVQPRVFPQMDRQVK